MPASIEPVPQIPEEIKNAAYMGELVVFVGAGVSRLVGCPGWTDFADGVLNQLVEKGAINYCDLDQLKSLSDPKKKLSIAKIISKEKSIPIDYRAIFSKPTSGSNIYSFLNKLSCTFVTTNYDNLLLPNLRKNTFKEDWRFYRKEDFYSEKLDVQGNVIHLHGNVDHDAGMVITTNEYLKHYSEEGVSTFLTYLFSKKTVLFLGYGLEELELLEYALNKGKAKPESKRLFMLAGFFKTESALVEMLKKYYDDSFSLEIIPYLRDLKNYHQLEEIVQKWAEELIFYPKTLADEAQALEDEING